MTDTIYQPTRESLLAATLDATRRAMRCFVRSGRSIPSDEYEAWRAAARRMNDLL